MPSPHSRMARLASITNTKEDPTLSLGSKIEFSWGVGTKGGSHNNENFSQDNNLVDRRRIRCVGGTSFLSCLFCVSKRRDVCFFGRRSFWKVLSHFSKSMDEFESVGSNCVASWNFYKLASGWIISRGIPRSEKENVICQWMENHLLWIGQRIQPDQSSVTETTTPPTTTGQQNPQ